MKPLKEDFDFDIDLAASKENAKCEEYICKSSLDKEWSGVGWLNPPYGGRGENSLKNWVKKSYKESKEDECTVVALIPARTNTQWWHNYCMEAEEIRLIKGRPKFIGADYGLPQPLAIVVFDGGNEKTKIKTLELEN